MNIKAIGAKIKAFRQDRGLSQDSLAELSGVARNGINDLEQGRGNPTVGTLSALAGPLGVKITEFFDVDKSARKPAQGPGPKGLPAPDFDSASQFLWLYSGLSPERQSLVAMLIYDDPAYVMDVPGIARVVEQLSIALSLRK